MYQYPVIYAQGVHKNLNFKLIIWWHVQTLFYPCWTCTLLSVNHKLKVC